MPPSLSRWPRRGLIVSIGRWVLGRLPPATEWQDRFPGPLPLVGCVNVSARQLRYPDLLYEVGSALEESGIEARSLVLEITESALVKDMETSMTLLRELRDKGVRVAMDDFGSEYSSLSYLMRLPVDFVMIDNSFAWSLAEVPRAALIVGTMISLAHTLGLETVERGREHRATGASQDRRPVRSAGRGDLGKGLARGAPARARRGMGSDPRRRHQIDDPRRGRPDRLHRLLAAPRDPRVRPRDGGARGAREPRGRAGRRLEPLRDPLGLRRGRQHRDRGAGLLRPGLAGALPPPGPPGQARHPAGGRRADRLPRHLGRRLHKRHDRGRRWRPRRVGPGRAAAPAGGRGRPGGPPGKPAGRADVARKRRKRGGREPLPTVDYSDDAGNVLTLRSELSDKTIAKIGEPPASRAASTEDAWRRREEMLFERLAVRWEIAGLPLDDQAMLLGRYRMADSRDPALGARDDRGAPRASLPGPACLAGPGVRESRGESREGYKGAGLRAGAGVRSPLHASRRRAPERPRRDRASRVASRPRSPTTASRSRSSRRAASSARAR